MKLNDFKYLNYLFYELQFFEKVKLGILHSNRPRVIIFANLLCNLFYRTGQCRLMIKQKREKWRERERERERERYDTFYDRKPNAIIYFFVPFFRKNEIKYIFMERV